MQMDFLLSRLYQLKERTDDTEDLINIELDQRRNELVSKAPIDGGSDTYMSSDVHRKD